MRAHIGANRVLVAERLGRVRLAVAEHGPITAYDVVPLLHGEALTEATAGWWLPETLSYLRHLEVGGVVARDGSEPERWVLA